MQNVPVRLGFQGGANVTGTIAGLASNAHAFVNFDLGPQWYLYSAVGITFFPVGPMGALNTAIAYGADAPALVAGDLIAARLLGISDTITPSQAKWTNLAPATGAQTVFVRPMGRYVTVDFQNQDGTNAAGAASAINFAAYPYT